MPALSSEAKIRLAKQSVKGTPVTSGFICGLVEQHQLGVEFTETAERNEHGCYATTLPVARRSAQKRTGYKVSGKVGGALYPYFFNQVLYGGGMTVASSGTTVKTNVFTIAASASAPWLTALSDIGGEIRGTDVRVPRWAVKASTDGVTYDADLLGLTESNAAGSETHVAEKAYGMSLIGGTITMTYDPAGTPVVIYSDALEIDLEYNNPLSEEITTLKTFGLSDLPQEGIDVNATIRVPDLDYNTYKRIVRGGTSGTAPSANNAIISFDFKCVSQELVTAGTVFSWQFTIPRMKAMIDMNDFDANGKDSIYWNLTAQMIADSGTPMTVTGISDAVA